MLKKLMIMLLLLLPLAACGSAETDSQPVDDQVAPTLIPPTPIPTVEATLPPAVVSSTGGDGAAVADSDAQTDAATDEAAEPVALGPWSTDEFGYGIQAHATIGDPGLTMEAIQDHLHVNWVKVQMPWPNVQIGPDQYDWGIWDAIVNEANENGLHLLFSVVSSPTWSRASGDHNGPPDDYNLYFDFLRTLTQRYPGKVHAIEVWNEQNIDREWTAVNGLSPVDYVALLKGSYEAIKSVDSNVIVISGALSPTGNHDGVRYMDNFIYLDEALAAGMMDYADCLGVHHNGYNIPPNIGYDEMSQVGSPDDYQFTGPMTNPHHSWSFKSTLQFSAEKVQAIDPDAKLCVTEFGWASSEGYDAYPPGFEYAADNTLTEQATFIVDAYNQMYDSGDVWLAFLFNFDFGNKSGGDILNDNVPYSIVDINGAPRPAFEAVSSMEKRP